MNANPPRLGLWLLDRLFDSPKREEVAGDLLEVMRNVAERRGPLAARGRYLAEMALLVLWRLKDLKPHRAPQVGDHSSSGRSPMESLVRDVRFAVRNLTSSPFFTAVSVATLGIGIGATVTLFSVVNGVLLRPLEFENPEELVLLKTIWGERSFEHLSQPDIIDIKAQNGTLTELEIWQQNQATLVGSDGWPERVDAAIVTNGFFSVLGIQPFLGRFFLGDEAGGEAEPVVVLSYGVWQRLYGGDPAVVGSGITVSGTPITVVGITPPGFIDPITMGSDYADAAEFWTLQSWAPNGNRSWRGFIGLGRLRPNVRITQASADVERIARALAVEYPQTNTAYEVKALPLHDRIVGGVRPALLMLFGAVGLVLLIACANVANLLLTRGVGRRQELAVRSALGAARGRIVSLLLTESLVLALLSGALGMAIAYSGVRMVTVIAGDRIPRSYAIEVDGTVLAFALIAALATSVVFGLLPALRASRPDLVNHLKEGAKGTQGVGNRRLRHALVVAEFIMSIVLMVGAGLLIKSFARMQSVQVGVDRENVLTFQMIPGTANYPDGAALTRFYTEVLAELNDIPGVVAAGVASNMPLTGAGNSVYIRRSDEPPPEPGHFASTLARTATPAFFAAMGTPILGGRAFDIGDDSAAASVAIINEAAVRRFFPTESPLGRTIRLLGRDWEVVGVVADVRQSGPIDDVEITTYIPYDQTRQSWLHRRGMDVTVRTSGPPGAIAAAVRDRVWSVNRDTPMRNFKTTAALYRERTWAPRFRTVLLSAFAALALGLAAVGITGVMSYSVSQRRREIGIRRALGASTGSVLGLVLSESLKLIITGAFLGVLVSLAAVRLLSGFLFGVQPLDVGVFTAIPLLLASVALLASYLPATIASRIEPAVTLRDE